jgi:hypothetical protein
MPHFTVADIAKRWKTNRETVTYWIRKGDLVAMNFSRGGKRKRYRVSEADLLAFEKCRVCNTKTRKARHGEFF